MKPLTLTATECIKACERIMNLTNSLTMRLLCINNKPIEGARNNPVVLSKIKEGEMYEGEQRRVKNTNIWAWCIPAISETEGYALERFIPLSDTPAEVIEETELVEA